ncbi:hypothetical protein SDC9_152363 [bioreactor metagenome]|uniref:Uncharacterized protein n=1 Tax=bioreactor metagenome TaxID=1076179 RepID=A0A645EX92_9ZZZZ
MVQRLASCRRSEQCRRVGSYWRRINASGQSQASYSELQSCYRQAFWGERPASLSSDRGYYENYRRREGSYCIHIGRISEEMDFIS